MNWAKRKGRKSREPGEKLRGQEEGGREEVRVKGKGVEEERGRRDEVRGVMCVKKIKGNENRGREERER